MVVLFEEIAGLIKEKHMERIYYILKPCIVA